MIAAQPSGMLLILTREVHHQYLSLLPTESAVGNMVRRGQTKPLHGFTVSLYMYFIITVFYFP